MTIWFLLIALLASPAWAAGKWSDCTPSSGDARNPTSTLNAVGQKLCWDYTAAGDDSPLVSVATSNGVGLVCLDPDIASETVGGATAMVRGCASGGPPDPNTCFTLLAAPLTGQPGSGSTQNACLRVSGDVYVQAIGAPTGTARITFRGE